MAKAAKSKAKEKKHVDEEFPLSEVQDLTKTKRKDPNDKKKKETPPAIKPVIMIEKVKVEDQNFLTVSYSKIESDGSTSNHSGVTFEGRWMHPDTRALFLDLRIHLALICEFISVQQLKNIETYNEKLVDAFTVLSVNIKDGEGVTLTGYKKLKRGPWNFNSLFTRFNDDQDNSYRYAAELEDLVLRLQQETIKYLDGTKVGKNPQGSLEFPSVDNHSLVEEEL
jgi:hypothetical protein